MQQRRLSPLLLCLFYSAHANQKDCGSGFCGSTAAEQCTLWLAESSIPGAGLGIFTTVERNEGDIIGKGEVTIPIIDYEYHLSALGIESFPGNPNFAYDYIWWGPEFGVQHESATPHFDLFAYVPGLDAAINCNLALINTHKKAAMYDALDLHRSRDPGAGAFTPYYNNTNYMTADVPAGGELFKYYGDSYFEDRESIFGKFFPLSDDHGDAETLLKRWDDLLIEFSYLPDEVLDDAWKLVTDFPIRSRLLNAIPRDIELAQDIAMLGTRDALTPTTVRDVRWIRQTGRCLEAIEARPSTIPQAGRGAFVNAYYPAGSIITGTPFHFIPTKDYFLMYEGEWYTKESKPDKNDVTNLQLTINYAFHHPESSIYLIPYGSGIHFINHNKTLANVKVQWAKNGEMGHRGDTLFESDPAQLKYSVAPGLFMDFVATRDILPGEELFMDYGDDWEQAWMDHVAKWNHHGEYQQDYKTGAEWNRILQDDVLRTVDEEKQNPYPENIMTHCFTHDMYPEAEEDDTVHYLWEVESSFTLPCRVLSRETVYGEKGKEDILYTVAYQPRRSEGDRPTWKVYEGLPRHAISFVDAPYSTDIMLPDAFRHPIGIPDDMFPDKWRGKYLTLP